MMDQTSDNVLAQQIKKGNQLAFAALYDRYNRSLYALAYRYLKSRDLSEDVVQQIFVNLWINRDQINEELNIKSFIFTSLKNSTLNTLRNNQRAIEKNYELLINQENYDSTEMEEEASHEMVDLINKVVDTLSPQRKLIFKLKIEEGLSNSEIAQKLNLSVNTVKFQYSQILKILREKVGKGMITVVTLISCLFN